MRTSITGTKGFTLVELTVVVVIISVLATMTVPRLYSSTGSTRLRESALRLALACRYARDFAANHRRECRLVFDSEQGSHVLTAQLDPEQRPDEFRRLATSVGRIERLGDGVRFGKLRIEPRPRLHGNKPRRDSITFDPSGQADAAVVEITDGRRTYSILVAPHTARVKVVDGVVGELPNDRRDLDD